VDDGVAAAPDVALPPSEAHAGVCFVLGLQPVTAQARADRADIYLRMMRIPDSAHGATHEHRLWWKPGTRGRGVLFDSGVVCTWPEGDATHRQWADQVPSRAVMFFYIRADGRVRIPERHADHAAQLIAALTAADRRLAPFAPPSHSRPPAPPAAEHPACPPASTGGRRHGTHRAIEHAWDARAAERLARIQRRY
jgi:hypothetical protein